MAESSVLPEEKAIDSEKRLKKILLSEPRPECWDDDWVRDVEDAVTEYQKHAKYLKETSLSTLFQKFFDHITLHSSRNASPSMQQNFLQVCQILCNSSFRSYIKDVPILQIGYFLCHFPRHGERSDVYVKLFSMTMSAFLHGCESITDLSQMNHKYIFICQFPEVVGGLQEFLLYMLKHKMDANCVLECWTKTFVAMKNVIGGDVVSRFLLDSFLADLKMLRRVDFDLDTLKKAFDSCFPGSFQKVDNITLFLLKQFLLAQANTIQINYEGCNPGCYVDRNIVDIYLFSRLKKTETGLMLMALFESPDVKSTKEGLVNYDPKKLLMKLTAPEIWKQFENAGLKWSIQDMVDSITVDEKSLNLIWYIQNTLDREGVKSKKRAFVTIVDLAAECYTNSDVDATSEKKCEEIRQELEKLEDEISSNWMGRNSLHLLALICNKEEVYSALERACPHLVKSLMAHRDVHGTTPYLLACACKNDVAREFFVRQGAALSETDFFGNTDEQLLQQSYLFWIEKETKPFTPLCQIDYDLHDREVCIQYVKQLFEMMIKEMVNSHPILEATMEIVGSVQEQTKVAQMDEFDIQILFQKLSARVRSYDYEYLKKRAQITFNQADDHSGLISEQGSLDMNALIDIINESMQKTLSKTDHSSIPLRTVDLEDPWLMIYEGSGQSKGMLISFDIVPVIEIPEDAMGGDALEQIMSRQSRILKHPIRNPLKVFLKRQKLDEPSLQRTWASSERNIINCLPVDARLGVVMIKSLLRQQRDCAITSYMVKTALFHALDEKIGNGEMSKLEQPENSNQWITNSMAAEYYNEGRKWAVDILTSLKTIRSAFLDELQTFSVTLIGEAASHVDGIIKLVGE